jgi:hypothetical protein
MLDRRYSGQSCEKAGDYGFHAEDIWSANVRGAVIGVDDGNGQR